MRKSKFSENQIIGIIREGESGVTIGELCRKHGISPQTYYSWKTKYSGMDASQLRELKGLQDENAKLKRLLADAMLESHGLKIALDTLSPKR
jgi:putative transposase